MGKKKSSRSKNNKKKSKRGSNNKNKNSNNVNNNNNEGNANFLASSSPPMIHNNTNNEEYWGISKFKPGRKAVIVHLKDRKELNGTDVIIQNVLPNGRVAVEYTELQGSSWEQKKQVSIKKENLEVIWEKICNDGQEGEECPICMDTTMNMDESDQFSCCGKRTCYKCFVEMQERDQTLCPFCKSEVPTCDEDLVSNNHARADRGDRTALHNLGQLYSRGFKGVSEDKSMARLYFKKAALKGCSDSANNLGCLYMNGEGGPVDYAEGMRWFLIASDLGSISATRNLSTAYVRGEGVPQDFDKGMMLLRKCADAGDELAIEFFNSTTK